MSSTADVFIVLLRSAVTGTNEEIDLSDVYIDALYSLARFHDLAHIVYYELKRRGKIGEGEASQRPRKQYEMAVFRHVRRDIAISQIREILYKAEIPFILLKGVVMMSMYPEPWMRTSSDVDVLVRSNDFEKASAAMKDSGMIFYAENEKDASFFSREKYHFELHHSLIEDGRLPNTTVILDRIWDYAEPVNGSSEYILSDEIFYFYHIAHMAKHFKNGGCGIRTFIDLWLLNHKKCFDREKRNELLREGGILEFAQQAERLSEKWFSGSCDADEDMERFIINGGTYGSTEHNIAITKKKTDNRFLYYLRRAFLPYNSIKHAYPVLKKWPVLLPFCWIARWFKIFDPNVRKRTENEIRIEKNVDAEESERIETMLKRLGIW